MKSQKITWVFDLDDTLHDATSVVFPVINQAMTNYVAEQLSIDHDLANQIRKTYWQRYGATLLGLMINHNVDPQDFLLKTHKSSYAGHLLQPAKNVKWVLRKLMGRKILFTNGPAHYAAGILKALGIRKYFTAVFGIEQMQYLPKPNAVAYQRLFRKNRLYPRNCIMVDDNLENLRTANQFGMRGIWISKSTRNPIWLYRKLYGLADLLRISTDN